MGKNTRKRSFMINSSAIAKNYGISEANALDPRKTNIAFTRSSIGRKMRNY